MSAPTNLVTIRPGVTLAQPAAAAFQRLEKHLGRQVDVNSSYRDWNTQYALWKHYEDTGKPPFALHPDKSMHCKGLAIDSDDHDRPGFIATAREYGWLQSALARNEPWHFDYYTTIDKHADEPTGGESASGGGRPVTATTREDDDMNIGYMRTGPGAGVYAVHPWLGTKRLLTGAEWAAAQAAGAVAATVERAEIDKVPTA